MYGSAQVFHLDQPEVLLPGSGGKHIPSRQSKLGQVHLLFPEYRPLLPKGKGSPLEPVGDPLARRAS